MYNFLNFMFSVIHEIIRKIRLSVNVDIFSLSAAVYRKPLETGKIFEI